MCVNVPGRRVDGGTDGWPRVVVIGNRTCIRSLRRTLAWLDLRHRLDPSTEDREGRTMTLPGSQRRPEVTHARGSDFRLQNEPGSKTHPRLVLFLPQLGLAALL